MVPVLKYIHREWFFLKRVVYVNWERAMWKLTYKLHTLITYCVGTKSNIYSCIIHKLFICIKKKPKHKHTHRNLKKCLLAVKYIIKKYVYFLLILNNQYWPRAVFCSLVALLSLFPISILKHPSNLEMDLHLLL